MAFDDDFDEEWHGRRRGPWGKPGPKGLRESGHPLDEPKLIVEFLDQGDAWAAREGYVKIEDMTPAHALRTAMFMLDKARDIALVYFMSDVLATDTLFERIVSDVEARRWLIKTHLVAGLLDRAMGEPATSLPWARVLR